MHEDHALSDDYGELKGPCSDLLGFFLKHDLVIIQVCCNPVLTLILTTL
jgi:hypothetical protein